MELWMKRDNWDIRDYRNGEWIILDMVITWWCWGSQSQDVVTIQVQPALFRRLLRSSSAWSPDLLSVGSTLRVELLLYQTLQEVGTQPKEISTFPHHRSHFGGQCAVFLLHKESCIYIYIYLFIYLLIYLFIYSFIYIIYIRYLYWKNKKKNRPSLSDLDWWFQASARGAGGLEAAVTVFKDHPHGPFQHVAYNVTI